MQRCTLILALALAPACTSPGDDGPGNPGDRPDGGGPGDGDAGGGDAGDNATFTELVTARWTAAAGTEPYWCARRTLTEDTYITSFRDLSPLGTHHIALTIVDNPTEPDGEFECDPGTLAPRMVFASGVGTDDFVFPDGVAYKIPAGSQLLLNLHLFNISNAPMTGTSGTLIQTVPASQVAQEAEFILAGILSFSVPATGQEFPLTGSCTFNQAATLLNIWPHMHQIGSHMKVTLDGEVLHDRTFMFTEQVNWMLEPARQVSAGQRMDVECRWINDTGAEVPSGDSSTREMCFAGFYRYPATGAPLYCVF